MIAFALGMAAVQAAVMRHPEPRFDPIAFFAGRTEGRGRLKVILRRGRAIHVRGSGRVEPDGTLVLDQVVRQGDAAPQPRRWRIRRVAPGRYAGTLTDARGPVAIEAQGDRLTIRFTIGGGVGVEQRLVLAPDGRSARNRLVARRFGVTLATLDETIGKLD